MQMKKLGFGFMRLPLTDPDNKASVDIELTKKMVDEFLARGFTYLTRRGRTAASTARTR